MKELMSLTLYNSEFVKMNNPPKDVEISKHEKYKEILEDYSELKSENSKQFITSSIIDGLKSIVDFATLDHEKITRMKYTGKRSIDNMRKKDVADYYERRVQNHANEIVSYVNGLVIQDSFPIEMFGNYKIIKQVLDLSAGIQKDKYLVDLYICAKTAIPQNIWETEQVIIEPSISTSSDINEV